MFAKSGNMITFLLLIPCINGYNGESLDMDGTLTTEGATVGPKETIQTLIENIKKIEELTALADNPFKPVDKDETEIYSEMSNVIDNIVFSITDTEHAHTFLESHGIFKVVSPNIVTENQDIKGKLLLLLKLLFDVAPVSTSAVIPNNMVDKLIDIFEYDDYLGFKSQALDVLYQWLPNNPKIQTRVMKKKGFVPFYKQVSKLNELSIKKLLDLFNKLFIEHLTIRGSISKKDYEKKSVYMRMGFMEHLGSPDICGGLSNMAEILWSYNSNGDVVKTVLETMKNIKPYCLQFYRHKTNTLDLLESIYKYVSNEDRVDQFDAMKVNITVYRETILEYLNKLKKPYKYKDEL